MATDSNNENGNRRNDTLDARADDGSFEIARNNRPQARWQEIEVNAPYVAGKTKIGTDIVAREAVIEIQVRELQGRELGALASPNLGDYVRRAEERKNEEDKAAYGRTTRELEQDARNSGYFGSPAHQAWAEAAEARTGGRLSSEWWMKFDPFGGTAGNGPNILPTGAYPGTLSKIAMGHDTDWSLGRHFQAGPLRGLYGVGHDAETRGKYGLDPLSPITPGVDIYTNGHPDWRVNYIRNPSRNAQVEQGDTTVVLAPGNDPVNRQFAQALQGANGDRDAAAAAIETLRNTPGYRPDQDIAVVQGRNGQLIATQGQGDAALNVPVGKVNPGDFERVANQIAQTPQPTQVAAVQPDQPERGRAV